MNPELKDLLALAQRGLANAGVYIYNYKKANNI